VNQHSQSPNILLAPLDWGLGHATRCIPLIRELLQRQCKVVLATSGKGKALLQQEFPDLPILPLAGYEIEYAAGGWELAMKIVAQIPKLLSAIEKEHLWLQKVVEEHSFDALISDNRYGLHHPNLYTIFLTHQLTIQTPFGFGKNILQDLNYNYINRFTECWVPDAEEEENLAGALSHPATKPTVPLKYTGPLSRFSQQHTADAGSYLLFLLSGPEPQRTLLEEKIVAELENLTAPFVIVRGLPGEKNTLAVNSNGIVYNHLPAAELEQLLAGASLVISRSGYSTIMDLAAMQKKSILIPTPGQTEQEYLAKHLMEKNFAFCVEQKKLKLKNILNLAEDFSYRSFPPMTKKLKEVVDAFVESMQSKKSGTTKKSAKSA
jgi:uncharacterized protein (TIGR00661 family)